MSRFQTKDLGRPSMVISSNPRVSYTASFRGLVVGGKSDYHPEKVDISITKTIDYIDGESDFETKQRLEDLETLTELLVIDVEKTISNKVKFLKENMKGR